MDYKYYADKCLKLFRETRLDKIPRGRIYLDKRFDRRARGPRRYGARVRRNDRSGFVNPRNHLLGPAGLDPGYGRNKVRPVKPIPPIQSIVR